MADTIIVTVARGQVAGPEGRQRTTTDQFWRDADLAGLDMQARYALLHLLTGPNSNIVGVYRVVPRLACGELGWMQDELERVYADLVRHDAIAWHPASGWVWVKVWWRHHHLGVAFGGKVAARARAELDKIPAEWRAAYIADLRNRGAVVDTVSDTVPDTPDHIPNSIPSSITPPARPRPQAGDLDSKSEKPKPRAGQVDEQLLADEEAGRREAIARGEAPPVGNWAAWRRTVASSIRRDGEAALSEHGRTAKSARVAQQDQQLRDASEATRPRATGAGLRAALGATGQGHLLHRV